MSINVGMISALMEAHNEQRSQSHVHHHTAGPEPSFFSFHTGANFSQLGDSLNLGSQNGFRFSAAAIHL